ncbi:MAG: protein kinase domain-containing protein [bacterium]|nr:MAG: protein kinase domain-containing protein [bacterium]
MTNYANANNSQLDISSALDVEIQKKISSRTTELFNNQQQQVFERTDRLFAKLLIFQWLVGIGISIWLSPYAWKGSTIAVHLHIWAAVFLGGILVSLPLYLVYSRPGQPITRHSIAMAQMLFSGLLIHLSGGRLETHFHVFGSLAFLTFYRNWRVLITATAVVGLDHLIRGVFWPQSVFGVIAATNLRWLEHVGWVFFEDFFLILACLRSVSDMQGMANQNAQLEAINANIERKVKERTAQLDKKSDELVKKNGELDKKNFELADTVDQLKQSKEAMEKANKELLKSNVELAESHRRADRIFSALAEALPGKILDDKYRLDSKIGSGGFGAVYKATQLALNRPIAVKVFRPTEDNASAENLERFLLEGISTCRVNHPNAVSVLDSGISSDGIAYLVMELLEGWSLSTELTEKGKLPIQRCVDIIIPVCDVLAEAHQNGIIHRDIKPDNIFLHQPKEGEIIKVVDFGIAKLVDKDEKSTPSNLTGTGNLIGTPTYMAPERLSNKPYDGRSDVYSLGILLYQMLAGCVPFDDEYSGIIGLVMMHLKESPPPLTDFDDQIPKQLEQIVMKTLIKNPEERISAVELGQALKEFAISYLDHDTPDGTSEKSLDTTSSNRFRKRISEYIV